MRSIRRIVLTGWVILLGLILGVGGWAAYAKFSGAVIASGSLVVDGNSKKVQHPTGGVVEKVFVRDGDPVQEGDVVVRLDETITRANYAALNKVIHELSVRQARLLAERDGRKALIVDIGITPEIEALIVEETRLLELRASARQGQEKQFRERVSQLREQIQGMGDQIAAKKREIELIGTELRGVRDLYRKNLVPITRVTALERDAARLEGERGSLISAVAQAKGRITETELQIIQIDQDLRAEVGRELAEIRSRLAELGERRVAAEDQLRRIDIRAPQDGIVHQLAVHTIGGVINASEPIMLIVPKRVELRAEVRINPQDIDHVRVGQKAIVRFTAFNQVTTPELDSSVALVSADVSVDQKTGASFYTVRLALSDEEIARLGGVKLTPGMPIEAFIQTGQRTVASYIAKPITDHVHRVFRER